MQFSALNSDSDPNPLSPQGSENGVAVSCTREAIESEAFKRYYNGLSLVQEGKLTEATAALLSVLDSRYITQQLDDGSRKVSNELLKGKACKLKFSSLRNLACICEKTQAWRECITWCEDALQIDNTDSMLWYRLGRASLRLLELELCAYALSEALSRSSYLTPARKSLIPVLFAIYRYEECLTQCSLLISRIPNSQLATDFALWILKSQPYTDPPDSKPIKALLFRLPSLELSDLEQSPHLKEGRKLRSEHKLAFPPIQELEEWAPDATLSAHSWLELGVYLLNVLREADEKRMSLNPCLLLPGETEREQSSEDQMDPVKGEEGEKKPHRRRGSDTFDFLPAAKRRSLRSSQQQQQFEERSQVLHKDMRDLVADFFAARWPYLSQIHCMASHPSCSRKPAMDPPDPRLLLRLQPPLEGEKDRVELFLHSHSLSPICSILLRYLEASAHIFLLAWPETSNQKLQSLISQIYLACHGRFLSLPSISPGTPQQPLPCKLETAYVVLMFIEIVAHQNTAGAEPEVSILEAAYFLEHVSYTSLIPCKQWYNFFLRSCWSLAILSQHRGMVDKQLLLLDHALQVFELYNAIPDSDSTLKCGPSSSQDSHLSDNSTLDGFSLEYPPDELAVIHPNIQTVISRSLVQESIEKAMMLDSCDKQILFDYFLRGENRLLIESIKPFVSNSPTHPISFLIAPLQTGDGDPSVNLVQLSMESIRARGDEHLFPLCLHILSNLVISISDKVEATQELVASTMEMELNTLSDVIELFVYKQGRGELKFENSSLFEGFVWSLLRILQFHWDIQNHSLRKLIPISPTICILFHAIRLHDKTESNNDITVDSHNTTEMELQIDTQEETPCTPLIPPAQAPDLCEKRTLLAQSKLNSLNPGLCFLFECHELFGGERVCCSQQGLLLHLLLQETSTALLSLGPGREDGCVREMLQGELNQILFCLFGYPAKKFRSLGLSEHRESEEFLPSFHWPSCQLILCHLCPSTLPSFDDNKSIGVSPDLTILCKRIAEYLPYQEYTLISPEQLESFIASECDSFPVEFYVSTACQESQCIARVYYVIADDYLKSHSSKAIEFYTKYLLFYPTHTDSWAGLTLAYFRKFQYDVSERKRYNAPSFVADIRDTMVRVSKCFKQANRLYPDHCQLLERFGHFCFQVNSFWRHLSTSLVLPETGEVYGDLPAVPDTESELEISLPVFQKALDFESHIAEPWLYHYLLAKIKMKLGRPLHESLFHLTSSARILHSDGASYPEHVDCNSTNYACEAIEVHYLTHSYLIKSLLKEGTGALTAVEGTLLALKEINPLSSSPPHDTVIELFMHTHKSQIFQALGFSTLEGDSSLHDRVMRALVESIHGLLVCLARFPTHYKPQYRLARTLWDISPEVFYGIVKSLLIGPITSTDFNNEKLLPLFNLKSNLFANMWALKSYDINRPGSFVYHMYRHTTLLFTFLAYRHSAEALVAALSLLKVKPESAKMYLREYERVQLYHTGLLITLRVLENVCSADSISSLFKPLSLLKVGYIIRTFFTKSSLPAGSRDQTEEKIGLILMKLYQAYRGGAQGGEHSLEKVLSFCALHTTVFNAGEQNQQPKKNIKPKSSPTQTLKPKPPLSPLVPTTSSF